MFICWALIIVYLLSPHYCSFNEPSLLFICWALIIVHFLSILIKLLWLSRPAVCVCAKVSTVMLIIRWLNYWKELIFQNDRWGCNIETQRYRAMHVCLHWENCLHFVYAPRCVSFFYAPNCINAPLKHLKKMHPAAFYFSCTYTNEISLRIIMKDYIITQTLINETALNCGFIVHLLSSHYCSFLEQIRNLKQFKAVSFSDIFSLR